MYVRKDERLPTAESVERNGFCGGGAGRGSSDDRTIILSQRRVFVLGFDWAGFFDFEIYTACGGGRASCMCLL